MAVAMVVVGVGDAGSVRRRIRYKDAIQVVG